MALGEGRECGRAFRRRRRGWRTGGRSEPDCRSVRSSSRLRDGAEALRQARQNLGVAIGPGPARVLSSPDLPAGIRDRETFRALACSRKVVFMEQSYWLGRKRDAAAIARRTGSSRARSSIRSAGRYSVMAGSDRRGAVPTGEGREGIDLALALRFRNIRIRPITRSSKSAPAGCFARRKRGGAP